MTDVSSQERGLLELAEERQEPPQCEGDLLEHHGHIVEVSDEHLVRPGVKREPKLKSRLV